MISHVVSFDNKFNTSTRQNLLYGRREDRRHALVHLEIGSASSLAIVVGDPVHQNVLQIQWFVVDLDGTREEASEVLDVSVRNSINIYIYIFW